MVKDFQGSNLSMIVIAQNKTKNIKDFGRNVYVKPGEYMRIIFSSERHRNTRKKEIPSSPNRSRTYDLWITTCQGPKLTFLGRRQVATELFF